MLRVLGPVSNKDREAVLCSARDEKSLICFLICFCDAACKVIRVVGDIIDNENLPDVVGRIKIT